MPFFTPANQAQRKILENFYAAAAQNLMFYETSTFFQALAESTEVDLTALAPSGMKSVAVGDPSGKQAMISLDRIRGMLARLRGGPEADALNYWCLANAARSTACTWREASLNPAFGEIVLADIFNSDRERRDNFNCILEFMTAALARVCGHEPVLSLRDFEEQKNQWTKNRGPTARFLYDYGDPANVIQLSHCLVFQLELNWMKITVGRQIQEIFPAFDLYMTLKFCYNVAENLRSRYLASRVS